MLTPENIAKFNSERLSGVMPELREKAERIVAIAKAAGFSLLVSQGFRTIAQQNALYAQGRTKPGKIVTHAKGGQSNHNFGKAVDFAFVDANGVVDWNPKLYTRLGAWAHSVGLKWGGDWKRNRDLPHVEL